jgi:surfeit locus 1 family protein
VTRQPLSITPRGVVGTILVLVVAAVCVRLGFWQLERRAQRAVLNAGLAARMAEPSVDLTRAPRDTAGWLYRRTRIAGVPDASRAIVLPGRLYQGAPGVPCACTWICMQKRINTYEAPSIHIRTRMQ